MSEWKWVPEDGCPSGCPEEGHYEGCPFAAFMARVVERLAHKAAEIGFTYGALGRDFAYAYKNVNDMLAEALAPQSEPPQTLGSQRTRR